MHYPEYIAVDSHWSWRHQCFSPDPPERIAPWPKYKFHSEISTMVIAKPCHENLHLIQKICYKRPSLFFVKVAPIHVITWNHFCTDTSRHLFILLTFYIFFIFFLGGGGEGEGAILKMSFPQGLILGLTHLLTLSNENISKEEIP